MDETLELKSCPFCGGRAKIAKHAREDLWRLFHLCPAVGTILIDWSYSEESLTDKWNTRAEDK